MHHHVYPAVPGGGLLEQGGDPIGLGNIRLDSGCLAACRLDAADDLVGLFGPARITHHDGEPVLGKARGDGFADAARTARDDGYLGMPGLW